VGTCAFIVFVVLFFVVVPTILLLVFIIGFILFLSLAGKKLDRYTLPAFPSLDLLADIVQRPDFASAELDRVRTQTLTATSA